MPKKRTIMTTYVLYHGNCPDGFGAAYAAWKSLGDTADYIPVQHHEPVPELEAGSDVYIVDFSYAADTLQELSNTMQRIIILDHHKSAQKGLAAIPSLEEMEKQQSNIGARFDMEKSGAILTWEFFHPNHPVPELLRYVQDKDLWKFKLPNSREVSAALGMNPFDFNVWNRLDPAVLMEEGKPLVKMTDRMVTRLASSAFWRELDGHKIPVVNTPILASQIGNHLCELYPDAPFVACYYDINPHQRNWELRSRGEFDVSEVATKLGGGGHKNASGFTESLR
jgi:oligoribonuclease NrnB/cAMP/cGMP phosphodiesterase (DHH superfamily)